MRVPEYKIIDNLSYPVVLKTTGTFNSLFLMCEEGRWEDEREARKDASHEKEMCVWDLDFGKASITVKNKEEADTLIHSLLYGSLLLHHPRCDKTADKIIIQLAEIR